ncbi:MAG: hypothetical protein JW809_18410 [Pirellulales bacterium]|nr:hypothetical protein [Pirellulales bacterium]
MGIVLLFAMALLAGCGPEGEPGASAQVGPPREDAGSAARALAFWERFDLEQLTDFQEKGLRPERLWPEDWGPPFALEKDRRLWRATLGDTLSEALARAERKAAAATRVEEPKPSRQGPPVATVEQVNADPAAWYDRKVRFENVAIKGPVVPDAEFGYLLAVTSPAGRRYPAAAQGERLLFSTFADAAVQLKATLADGRTIRATIDCNVAKGRRMVLTGMRTFPKAVVYRVEIYPE